jgi:hypothetical protein
VTVGSGVSVPIGIGVAVMITGVGGTIESVTSMVLVAAGLDVNVDIGATALTAVWQPARTINKIMAAGRRKQTCGLIVTPLSG